MCPQNGPGTEPWEIDFTPPFKRISMIEGLEKALKRKFPSAKEFDTPGMLVSTLCEANHIDGGEARKDYWFEQPLALECNLLIPPLSVWIFHRNGEILE